MRHDTPRLRGASVFEGDMIPGALHIGTTRQLFLDAVVEEELPRRSDMKRARDHVALENGSSPEPWGVMPHLLSSARRPGNRSRIPKRYAPEARCLPGVRPYQDPIRRPRRWATPEGRNMRALRHSSASEYRRPNTPSPGATCPR